MRGFAAHRPQENRIRERPWLGMKSPKFTGNHTGTFLPLETGIRERERSAHSGELVAGVADKHTGLAHGAVADRDALDEPRGAGRHGRACLSPILRAQRRGETEERSGRGDGPGGEGRSAFSPSLGWCLVRVFLEKRVMKRVKRVKRVTCLSPHH